MNQISDLSSFSEDDDSELTPTDLGFFSHSRHVSGSTTASASPALPASSPSSFDLEGSTNTTPFTQHSAGTDERMNSPFCLQQKCPSTTLAPNEASNDIPKSPNELKTTDFPESALLTPPDLEIKLKNRLLNEPAVPIFDRNAVGGIPQSAYGQFVFTDSYRQSKEILLKIRILQVVDAIARCDWNKAYSNAMDAGGMAEMLENKLLIAKCYYWRALGELGLKRYEAAFTSATFALDCKGWYIEGDYAETVRELASEQLWSSPSFSGNHNIFQSRRLSPEHADWTKLRKQQINKSKRFSHETDSESPGAIDGDDDSAIVTHHADRQVSSDSLFVESASGFQTVGGCVGLRIDLDDFL